MHYFFQVFILCIVACGASLIVIFEYRNKQFKKLQYLVNDDIFSGKMITLTDYGYTLRYCVTAKVYIAGCRMFTARQAIEHWSRNVSDDMVGSIRKQRAILFLKAIERHQKQLKK